MNPSSIFSDDRNVTVVDSKSSNMDDNSSVPLPRSTPCSRLRGVCRQCSNPLVMFEVALFFMCALVAPLLSWKMARTEETELRTGNGMLIKHVND